MILLANEVQEAAADQPCIGGMNIGVERNAFGSQLESFETTWTYLFCRVVRSTGFSSVRRS